jgi:hypothetical protein
MMQIHPRIVAIVYNQHTMETIKVRTRLGEDGVLKLELATGMVNQEIEVLVVMQPLDSEPVDAMGYPIGYFEETYGSFADDPLARGDEPPLDVRDELE